MMGWILWGPLGLSWRLGLSDERNQRLSSLPLKPPLTEVSGVAQHLSRPQHYWVHNDSLDEARVFLVNERGALVSEHKLSHTFDAESERWRAVNVDWEDIASTQSDPYDGDHVLYIADSGNNFHWRQDLRIYAFHEPSSESSSLKLISVYPYRFPHQTRTPPTSYDQVRGRCLDSEALFWWRGELFLIGKCVFGGPTRVWRLPRELLTPPHSQRPLQRDLRESVVGYPELTLSPTALLKIPRSLHPLKARVTAATAHSKVDLLAVLTYQSVWLFKLSGPPRSPHIERVMSCPLTQASAQPIRQAEAIEWRDLSRDLPTHHAQLLILTEGRGVHTLSMNLIKQECL